MLVLSRKSGEKIHVGNDVVIEIKRVTGSRVTIAIDAPRDVRILRGELKTAATAFEDTADAASPTGAESGEAEPAGIKDEPAKAAQSYIVSHQQVTPTEIAPPPVIN